MRGKGPTMKPCSSFRRQLRDGHFHVQRVDAGRHQKMPERRPLRGRPRRHILLPVLGRVDGRKVRGQRRRVHRQSLHKRWNVYGHARKILLLVPFWYIKLICALDKMYINSALFHRLHRSHMRCAARAVRLEPVPKRRPLLRRRRLLRVLLRPRLSRGQMPIHIR